MHRARLLVPLLMVALQILVLVTLVVRPGSPEPRDAPVSVVASDVIATAVADEVNAADQLKAIPATDAEDARRDVETGVVIAAVVVDLSAETDTVYVAGANGTQLNEAVVAEIEKVEAAFGRTPVVMDVNPPQIRRSVPFIIVAVGLALGFGSVIVQCWRRGKARRHLAERIGTDALAFGVALGLAAYFIGLPGTPWVWIGFGALMVITAGTLTSALERLCGAWGFGIAGALFILTSAPLVRATHPLLFPAFWGEITPWMPHGAGLDIATNLALFGNNGSLRSWLICVAWTAISTLTIILATRESRRMENA